MKGLAFLSAIALLAGCARRPAAPYEHTLRWPKHTAEAPGDPTDTTLPEDQRETALAANPFPVLYFDFDSAELRPSEGNKLHELTDRLTGHCILEGYASPEGDAAYNLALSHARAAAAQTYLAQAGTKARLEVIGYGDMNGRDAGNPGAYWMDRRVEVACQ